ncbi:RelA/SpoT domain-containing protein [Salininema proteolyticum]|uniref:RelA/SpoT domain-containing protein n=1 Tax=Salininema proteolyticum TaxID=1607685 RepID=A0ABV8U4K8_9ACTN
MWTRLQFSKREAKRAGVVLAGGMPVHEHPHALAVLNNWRSAHGYPLHVISQHLQRIATDVESSAVVARRFKRLPSIVHKLERFPSLHLAKMQDVAGCRVIMPSIEQVRDVDALLRAALSPHRLVRHNDYLAEPKSSGYRGLHLVYGFHDDGAAQWNGLHVEIQMRTVLEHAWSTAVETAGLVTAQTLKSSRGHALWLRFFQLASALIAAREHTAPVPEAPTSLRDLRAELKRIDDKIGLLQTLTESSRAFDQSVHAVHDGGFVLLALNPHARSLSVTGFATFAAAAAAYEAAEVRMGANMDVVLVGVNAVKRLENAYPNYFLNADPFVQFMNDEL